MTSPRKAANREAIMDSALKLFSERGYDAVRIEDITRTAGVSRATFYNHFSEREEILAALFERLLGSDGEAPDGSTRDVPDEAPLHQIEQVVSQAAHRMVARPELAKFLYGLPVRQEALLKPDAQATPTVFRRIHRLLEEASARGELRGDVPIDLMCIHVHNALEAAMRAWAEGRADDPAARAQTLVELALYGVAARPIDDV